MSSGGSLSAKVRPVAAASYVVAAHFLRNQAWFALGSGELLSADGGERIKLHSGAILAAGGDGARLLTAGDDGRLIATDADARSETVAEVAGKWIDHVALGPNGAIAWSVGKNAVVKTRDGERRLELPSSVGGLAFAPKGLRLAISHYNGATLWFPNAAAKPQTLAWKGSHLEILFSPDGRFLLTSMQEPTLHGWRLADGHHMRMSGYPGRVRSLAFSADGKWLATSGAPQPILWPFAAKDGPTGKEPRMLAAHPGRVSAVACHPRQPVLAAGFSDGLLLLIRLDDGAELTVREADGGPISALSWRADGQALAFGGETGAAGLLAL